MFHLYRAYEQIQISTFSLFLTVSVSLSWSLSLWLHLSPSAVAQARLTEDLASSTARVSELQLEASCQQQKAAALQAKLNAVHQEREQHASQVSTLQTQLEGVCMCLRVPACVCVRVCACLFGCSAAPSNCHISAITSPSGGYIMWSPPSYQ